MNDSDSSLNSTAQATAVPSNLAVVTQSSPRNLWSKIWNILVPLLLFVAFFAVVLLWIRLDRVDKESRLRSNDLAARTVMLENQSKLVQEAARELATRATAMEARVTEAAGQQAQLEKLYSNRATDEVDSLIADIEQSVSLANQQLLVSGQVASALMLLQEADRSAVKSKNTSLLVIHRLLLRDIEKLKASPAIDTLALATRIETISQSLMQLSLLTDLPGVAGSPAVVANQASSNRWVGEIQRLFRVHKVDDPAALLVSPEQAFFIRQNAQLSLASARLALLSRNEALFKSDINKVASAVKSYFDTRNGKVANQLANLEQLSATKIAVELPSLVETLNSVRAARSQR
jgi:uroporphyrin-III C-methyltransferase